jgi:hypothetical protein
MAYIAWSRSLIYYDIYSSGSSDIIFDSSLLLGIALERILDYVPVVMPIYEVVLGVPTHRVSSSWDALRLLLVNFILANLELNLFVTSLSEF